MSLPYSQVYTVLYPTALTPAQIRKGVPAPSTAVQQDQSHPKNRND